ncbi:alpha/beta hydrolase fold domain-containing protein [Victivallis sp. Marseille-Q1083]|uniref:alpha/beta hydrolase fold domain-containing protein n=1 Tax=Victivallis sp. Marseille-Q1083 TaxID=2717288 RepID=UPI00158D9051|nr:alpha/beta hydrolase fold domain-containing protein [Victivallis sp. Marseille-Q1083]
MRKNIYIALLLAGIAVLSSFAADLTPETVEFLQKRAPGQQAGMTAALREAIAGNSKNLNVIRDAMAKDTPAPENVIVENRTVDTCRMRLYLPEKADRKSVVLYLHGGGWAVGALEGSSRFCGDLAKATGIAVAPLSYRLAPEHPYPAALDDVLAAIVALKKDGFLRIYLAGDSAGGNLAAAAALKLRNAVSGLILYYPVTLARSDDSPSWKAYGSGYGLDAKTMEAFNDTYATRKTVDIPLVSPLLATEFKDFPPTLIVAADHDILFDQGKAFAGKLRTNHIPVDHRVIPGTIHAFMTYPGMEQAYQYGLNLAVAFLRKWEKHPMNSVTPDGIVRLSRVTVDPEQLEEYLAFVTECGTRSMAEEPGVLMMYSMVGKAQPNMVTILEIYADHAAYKSHIKTPHFQKYKQGTLKMVQKLELLDQTPLVPEMKMK